MKRILALLLALLLLAFSLVACSDKEDEGEEEGEEMAVAAADNYYNPDSTKNDAFTYERINGDEAKITGFRGDHTPHAVTVPATIVFKSEEDENVDITLAVTQIADSAFRSKTNISAITIPEGVTTIGQYAFAGCSVLASVSLPSTLTEIGQAAFAMTGLTAVTVPDAVTVIGMAAFYRCTALTDAKLSQNVKNLDAQLFMGCTVLDNVIWSTALETIGANAFNGCSKLGTDPDAVIAFPQTLTSIGDYAFANCSADLTARPGAGVEVGVNAFFCGM